MHERIDALFNACDPNHAATKNYYTDCTAARGDSALTTRFIKELYASGTHLRFLFTGHIGSGKSSELRELRRELQDPSDPNAPHSYFPVYLDADEYIDRYDVTPTDIHLAIVAELAAAMANTEYGPGIHIDESYFRQRLDDIKQFLMSPVEIAEGDLTLWNLKLKIKRLRGEPTAREQVRGMLRPQLTTMLSEINQVFDEARGKLIHGTPPNSARPYKDIVLILDNLEKIERITGYAEGEESLRELFIERAPQLTGLKAHVIYTVPLRLMRSYGTPLANAYGVEPFVLPMVKVVGRDRKTPYPAGQSCLRELLQKRLGDTPLMEAFTTEALESLINYSGGSIRTLMRFVREACLESSGFPIGTDAANRALVPSVRTLAPAIPDRYWQKLAQLDADPHQDIDNNDADYRDMLEKGFILEYMNGNGSRDVFDLDDNTPWYGVNPIIRELRRFKEARGVFPA